MAQFNRAIRHGIVGDAFLYLPKLREVRNAARPVSDVYTPRRHRADISL